MFRTIFFNFVVVAAFFSQSVFANNVVWLKVTPSFSYKDISTICASGFSTTTFYFGAEVEGTKVTRAVMTDNTMDLIADKIAFLPSELSGTDLYEDKFGQLWLNNLSFSARILDWAFKNAGDSTFSCKPSQPLRTISPVPFVFRFNVEGLGEGVVYSDSQLGTFKGQRKDGASYVATLRFSQKQYDPKSESNRYLLINNLFWKGIASAKIEEDFYGFKDFFGTSPVFSDRQDCRAMAMENAGFCRGQDCRAVCYHSISLCRSNDCRAMVRGLLGQCETRDCKAIVLKSAGYCESSNCQGVFFKNQGLCR